MHEADETCVEESEQALLEGDTRFASGTARSALRHKEFRSLFVWAWFSNIGTWMQQIVLAAFAYDLTGSSAFVGQLVFAQLGPVLFLGPIGGVIADLVDRRKLLLIVTFGQIVAAVGLAAVVATDDPSRELMFLAALASGVGFAIFAPAYSAMLPMLVGKEDLPGAIALNSTQMNASRVVGPAIGGIAFATIGPSWVFLANAASYLFVVWALVRVTLPTVPAGEPEPIRRKLLGGMRAARRDPVVGRSLVIITTFSFFSIVYVGMMPVLAADNLGHRRGEHRLRHLLRLLRPRRRARLDRQRDRPGVGAQARPRAARAARLRRGRVGAGAARLRAAVVPGGDARRRHLLRDGDGAQHDDAEPPPRPRAGPGDGAVDDGLRRHRRHGEPRVRPDRRRDRHDARDALRRRRRRGPLTPRARTVFDARRARLGFGA